MDAEALRAAFEHVTTTKGSLYYMREPDGRIAMTEDALTWGKWLEDHKEDRTILQDTLEDVGISTVFLAMDHSYLMDGPPVLFETMVFGGLLDRQCFRYISEDEARLGHEAILLEVSWLLATDKSLWQPAGVNYERRRRFPCDCDTDVPRYRS